MIDPASPSSAQSSLTVPPNQPVSVQQANNPSASSISDLNSNSTSNSSAASGLGALPLGGSGMSTASSVNIDLPTDAAMNQALEQLKHLDETLPPSDAAAVPSPMITPPAGSSAPTEDSAPNDNSGSTAGSALNNNSVPTDGVAPASGSVSTSDSESTPNEDVVSSPPSAINSTVTNPFATTDQTPAPPSQAASPAPSALPSTNEDTGVSGDSSHSSTPSPNTPQTAIPSPANSPKIPLKSGSVPFAEAPKEPAAKPNSAAEMPDFNDIFDVLIYMGELSQERVEQLRIELISNGISPEEIIEQKKLVTEEVLTKAKAMLHSVPFIKLTEVGIFPEAINMLPEGSARHYRMVPFTMDKNENTLSVAMNDPLDLTAIDFAQQKTGMRIIAHYAMPSEVERAITEYYSQTLSSEVSAALEQTSQVAESQQNKQDLSQLSGETIRQAPITKIVETVVTFAIKARASDIHIEPLEDRTRVRYRIDGILQEKLILPKSVHEAVISRIKILSGLKIDEKRLPQDGRFNFVALEQEVDLRISTLPTVNGEKVVMRLLKKDAQVPELPELGLDGLSLRNVQDAIKVPHGIILITGPTGSGKTTTLYSVLHKINTPKVNIMTLEDPVEYKMIGINQVQVNPQAGLTFASGLRSFLRQDPNVIMVGEIRDSETAELAIQAALTGHLVFSTLHTSSAAGALPRLMDMGAEPFLLASSMTLVAAQRVLRKINPDYKEEYKPEAAVVEDIKKVLADKFLPWCRQHHVDPNNFSLFRPKNDRPQNEPEYKGRIAIFEVMKITEEIGKLILERKPASEMEKLALKDGMLLMKQDGYLKALAGITTIEEVLRVAEI